MREAGEPMACGIFDFYKVFSRILVRRKMGQGGVRVGGRDVVNDHVFEKQVYTQLTYSSLTIIPHT